MSEQPFTVAADGDPEEQKYWPRFVRQYFPSYETFWLERVVPLTHRVTHSSDFGFQTTSELARAGFTDEDVAVAQLHYSLLIHLGRVFDELFKGRAFANPSYLPNRTFDQNAFFECFTRLSGASDVADEVLARRATPGTYDAWSETDGSTARRAWRKDHDDPLQPIRAYRNRLVHGRVVPEFRLRFQDEHGADLGTVLFYPRVDQVDKYLDWRVAFAPRAVPGPGSAVVSTAPPPDFDEAALIVLQAWKQAVDYAERAWVTHLLPSL